MLQEIPVFKLVKPWLRLFWHYVAGDFFLQTSNDNEIALGCIKYQWQKIISSEKQSNTGLER